jgi:OmpR-family two-component system manganese-sensing sensor histidine kinase
MVQPQWQSVPLDALLMEVIEEQQLVAAEKGISLSLHLLETSTTDEDAFTLQGDWNQLARLFTNLVSNAVQYTSASTETPDKIAVQVELQQIERSNNVGGRNTPSLLKVEVRDTGIGIPEAALPHIFDRFYRVDPARTHDTAAGSGLGLAIAQAIVENHHGHIQVMSVLNQGTTVTVTLPASKPEIPNSSRIEASGVRSQK